MIILLTSISILLTCSFLYFTIKEIQEIIFIRKILTNVIGKTKVESINDIIDIKQFLNNNISYNSNLKTQKRPLLRNTATQILKSKYGFCGENARVAIKMFLIGGVIARRIYLYGKKWQHVVIEHQTNKQWYMFDGHLDPETKLKDTQVASIPSEDIAEYPNGYKENPYIDFCRIKLFYAIPPFKFLSMIKLPKSVVYLMESPYLIKSVLSFFLLIISGGILLKLN